MYEALLRQIESGLKNDGQRAKIEDYSKNQSLKIFNTNRFILYFMNRIGVPLSKGNEFMTLEQADSAANYFARYISTQLFNMDISDKNKFRRALTHPMMFEIPNDIPNDIRFSLRNYYAYDLSNEECSISLDINICNFYTLDITNNDKIIKVETTEVCHNIKINLHNKTYTVKRFLLTIPIFYISKRKNINEFLLSKISCNEYTEVDDLLKKVKFVPFYKRNRQSTVDTWIRGSSDFAIHRDNVFKSYYYTFMHILPPLIATEFIIPEVYGLKKPLDNFSTMGEISIGVGKSFSFLCNLGITRSLMHYYIEIGDYKYIMNDLCTNSLANKVIIKLTKNHVPTTSTEIDAFISKINFIEFSSENDLEDFLLYAYTHYDVRQINNAKPTEIKRMLLSFVLINIGTVFKIEERDIIIEIGSTVSYNDAWKHVDSIVNCCMDAVENFYNKPIKDKTDSMSNRYNTVIRNHPGLAPTTRRATRARTDGLREYIDETPLQTQRFDQPTEAERPQPEPIMDALIDEIFGSQNTTIVRDAGTAGQNEVQFYTRTFVDFEEGLPPQF